MRNKSDLHFIGSKGCFVLFFYGMIRIIRDYSAHKALVLFSAEK